MTQEEFNKQILELIERQSKSMDNVIELLQQLTGMKEAQRPQKFEWGGEEYKKVDAKSSMDCDGGAFDYLGDCVVGEASGVVPCKGECYTIFKEVKP